MNSTQIDSSITLPLDSDSEKRILSLVGETFGLLTVIELSGYRTDGAHRRYWKAKCQCGKIVIVSDHQIQSEKFRSCGCLPSDVRTTHGMTRTTEYRVWIQMVRRCTKPNSSSFYLYGARGIKVCDRWLESFENFFNDMGFRPKRKTLERKDNDGNYEPSNCVWATPKEQALNRRTNHVIEFNGQRKCAIEWEAELGFPMGQIQRRLYKGWTLERAMTTPCACRPDRRAASDSTQP